MASSATPASSRSPHVTALSGKVQGLKFMQRAQASNPTAASPAPASPSPAGPSRSLAAPTKAKEATSSSLSASAEPKFTSLDGNDEHWSLLRPPPSTRQPTKPEAASQPEAFGDAEANAETEQGGWNTWFLHTSSASAPAASGTGRRKFGKFAEDEERGEDGEAGDQNEKRQRKKKRQTRESLSPEFEFDSDGGVQGIRKASKKKQSKGADGSGLGRGSFEGRAKARQKHRDDSCADDDDEEGSDNDGEVFVPTATGFLKPGSETSRSKGSKGVTPYQNNSDLEGEEVDEDFADHDDAPSLRKKKAQQDLGKKKSKKKTKGNKAA